MQVVLDDFQLKLLSAVRHNHHVVEGQTYVVKNRYESERNKECLCFACGFGTAGSVDVVGVFFGEWCRGKDPCCRGYDVKDCHSKLQVVVD